MAIATHSIPYSIKMKQKANRFLPLLKETASDWMEDNAMRLSAALALYTILSLAPLLVISAKVMGMILHNKASAQKQIQAQLTSLMGNMGTDAGNLINAMLRKGGESGHGLWAAIFSFAVLAFSATGVFVELQDSMNTIWGVKPKPNQGVWGFVRHRLLSLAMVFGIGFLLLVSMFISAILTTMARYIVGNAGWVAHALDIVVSLGVITLLFAAIFKFLPDVKLEWRHVWLGAVLTAVLFTVGKYLLAVYFAKAAPASAFGALGAPVAILLWIYYSAFILFFGAEFTKVWTLHHDKRVVPEEHAVKVTEEDRAQRGIPSPKRMEKALTGAPFNRLPPPMAAHLRHDGHHGPLKPMDYALAAGGVVAGAIAGGLGARYLLGEGTKPARKHLAAVKLEERLKDVEHRLGRVSRIKEYLEDMAVKERIDKVEKEIRRAGTHLRAQETGRPTWAVRLADWIGGRWSNL